MKLEWIHGFARKKSSTQPRTASSPRRCASLPATATSKPPWSDRRSRRAQPSTLYRTFPSKDLIVLDRLTAFSEHFSAVFARHSDGPPTGQGAGRGDLSVLAVEDQQPKETLLVRSIIDKSPIARARLWDYMARQQRDLANLIADRLHAKTGRSPRSFHGSTGLHDLRPLRPTAGATTAAIPPPRQTATELMRLLHRRSHSPRPPAKKKRN